MGVWERLSNEAAQRTGSSGALPEWTDLGKRVVLWATVVLVVGVVAFNALTTDDTPPTSTTTPPPAVTITALPPVSAPPTTAPPVEVVAPDGSPADIDPAAVAAATAAAAERSAPASTVLRLAVTAQDPDGSPVTFSVSVDGPDGIVTFDVTVQDTTAGWEEVGGAAPAGR